MITAYDVLRKPLITEKSAYLSSKLNQYAFEVRQDATRTQVKDAVERAFDVKVLNVNIINVPAKMGRKGRSRRISIRKSALKKAVVTLRSEDRIPVFEGVEQ